MEIYKSDSIHKTQKSFWTVLGALSGVTYLLAGLGLFGSTLSAEVGKSKWEKFKNTWNGLFSKGKAQRPQEEAEPPV